MSIDWNTAYFVIELYHKDCPAGGKLKYLARAGVDIHGSISVDVFCCGGCGKVVTNLEDKQEFVRRYLIVV